ncbi:MAG: membrane protein insertase YidC [Proteobacteria bacterium]|nr:membrane protein insertase YidC [Desulfobacula sp.]MBU3954513.1 membrane protein insertase YidC [Pseudomonadota bacterium]MBU4130284.1 membrane protein insertase YidC [Pseudomonadota bacterium]
MDEQKRLLLAVVLSVVVLVGYQYFFTAPPELNNPSQEVQNNQVGQANAPTNAPNVSDYAAGTAVQSQAVQNNQSMPAVKEYRTISVSTPLYEIAISEHLAAVRSFELKGYKETNQKNSPLKQLVPSQLVNGTLSFDMEGGSIQGLDNAVYAAGTDTAAVSLSQGEKTIAFSWVGPQGISVKKIFTFRADSFLVDCNIIVQNGSGMPLNDAIVISMPGFYDEAVKKQSRFAYQGPMAYINGKYQEIDPDDIEDQDTFNGKIDWAGYTSQYFMTTVMPKAPAEARLKLSYTNDIATNRLVQKMDRLDPGKQGQYDYTYYMGPKSYKILGQYENSLKKAINFGWFDIIAKPLLITMNTIHDFIPNYGIAIILLTILIKLIFWPLGTKSYKSMNEMKKVQPLMMELREKYKNDKTRMNQEVMGLYKTYKVNPASGCLPLLVQMPIFFALYRMLYQAIELRHAPFIGWISDLSAPDRLFNFNFAIPMMDSPHGIPVLTLLMGASFLLQQKMTPTAGDPMQAKMMMLMPIFMTVLFINFPAGLVLYMFVNNIISMGQQYYTQKKFS